MKFNYQARSKDGKIRTGIVEAASKDGALMLLQKHGLYITHLEGSESVPLYARDLGIGGKASAKDLVIFSRQLAIMFRSKVSLVESLRTLADQSEKPRFKEKIVKISEGIEGGISFSQSLAAHPDLFNSFYVNMVKSGEASGKLSESLDYLADHVERDHELKQKIKGAMMYPLMILGMMVGIMFLMTFYVIPQLTSILQDSETELPLITRIIITGTTFARSIPGVILIIVIIVGCVVLLKFSKKGKGKDKTDRIILKIPVLGNFVKMVSVARFAENLSTLATGGLPIAKALEISGSTIGNVLYEEAIADTTEGVKRGEKISAGLKNYPKLFPPMFTTMVLVAEKTGTMDTTLSNVVRFYQGEVDRALESLLRVIEPLLIMILGGGVGILIAAILLPLYSTVTSI